MPRIITSIANKTFKEIRSLQTAKGREETGLFIVEGERFVEEALACGADIRAVVFSESFYANPTKQDLIRNAQAAKSPELLVTPDRVFGSLCETDNPQGVLAVASAEVRPIGPAELAERKPVIVLDRIQDPGNLGTIIRSADAFGFGAVILMKGCVDIYNPKVLRSTMGSIFHITLLSAEDAGTCAACLKKCGFAVIAADADPSGNDSFEQYADPRKPKAIVIGNEANGVSDEFKDLCDHKVRIPMPGRAESLNAAVAASILMYEEIRKGMIR